MESGAHTSPLAGVAQPTLPPYDLGARQTPVKRRSTRQGFLFAPRHNALPAHARWPLDPSCGPSNVRRQRSPPTTRFRHRPRSPAPRRNGVPSPFWRFSPPLAIAGGLATTCFCTCGPAAPPPARGTSSSKRSTQSAGISARPDVVLANGDRLRLNPKVVTSDVAELEAALDRGESERARVLFRGPFLDGVSLGDVPEFDRWARTERERLEARVAAVQCTAQLESRPHSDRYQRCGTSAANTTPLAHASVRAGWHRGVSQFWQVWVSSALRCVRTTPRPPPRPPMNRPSRSSPLTSRPPTRR